MPTHVSRDAFYAAIGEALDGWAIIEAHLCSIFAVAVTAKEYAPAAAAFSAIIGFEAQLKMVHSAMGRSFALDFPQYLAWDKLRKKLDKLRPSRNRLAHGKVVSVVLRGGAISWRFLPYFHFFTHKVRDEFVHLKLADVMAITADFRKAVGDLYTFGKAIGARQKVKAGKLLPVD